MNEQKKNETMTGLLALLPLMIFAVCILAVLLTGAEVYRNLVERDRDSYDRRTVVSYLATKVRQSDRGGAITLEEMEGQDVLVVTEDLDGSLYETWIYYYDGAVRELFAAADSGLTLDAGTEILEAAGLQFSRRGSILEAEVTAPDGTTQSVHWKLRSGEEVVQ